MDKTDIAKRVIRGFLIFQMILMLPFLVYSQEQQTLAIMDFTGLSGVSQQEAQLLTNRLRTLLVQTDAYNVIERGQMEQILEEQNFQLAGCTSQECAVEVGQLLGAQLIMIGDIGMLGQTLTVDLRIIDVGTAEILRTASYDIRGEIDLMLTEGMVEVARRISGESTLGAGPRYGTINVSSEPSGAQVFINNEERGSTPFSATELAAGEEHTIRIMLEGYQPVTRTVNIQEGDNPAINVSLQESYGRLNISSQPAGARVTINEQDMGTTPLLASELTVGEEHRVRIALEGFEPVTRTVMISEGENNPINVQLTPATNYVSVLSRPDEAEVTIDNRVVGITPLQKLEYRIGMHSIEVSKRGYRPHIDQFQVQREEPTLLNIRLRSKSRGTAFLLSMFVPGAGHFYRARPLGGLFFLAATGAAGYLAYDNYSQFMDYQDQYQTMLDEYNTTTNMDRAMELRGEIQTVFDEMKSMEEELPMYMGILGGVYSLNLLTVVF